MAKKTGRLKHVKQNTLLLIDGENEGSRKADAIMKAARSHLSSKSFY